MERSVIIISILVLACVGGSAAALIATNVSAYWVNFFAIEYDYDMNAASDVYCATWDADKPYEWRSKYNWTAYCSPDGPQGKEACGLCLNVTNNRTGDQTIVRIVSTCSGNALDLDKPVFDQLDTDGNGEVVGHLTVDYEFVDCEGAEPAGPGETNVTAYWNDYNPKNTGWDYNAADVFCAAVDGGKPLEWRSKYGWTAICGNVGPQGEEACGKCLKVTNRDTKDEETVRIVDICGSHGLELDLETAFNPIDTNGKGRDIGHLMVDYEFVDCDDSSQENKVLVYSE